MNKYRDKSDFEINKAVAERLGYGFKNGTAYSGFITMPSFDPCNNPADAMPIVIENKITVAYDHHDCVWCAYIGSEISAHSDNYYRAAMICFLIMKDAENEKV